MGHLQSLQPQGFQYFADQGRALEGRAEAFFPFLEDIWRESKNQELGVPQQLCKRHSIS